jgi:hypothetical protein
LLFARTDDYVWTNGSFFNIIIFSHRKHGCSLIVLFDAVKNTSGLIRLLIFLYSLFFSSNDFCEVPLLFSVCFHGYYTKTSAVKMVI